MKNYQKNIVFQHNFEKKVLAEDLNLKIREVNDDNYDSDNITYYPKNKPNNKPKVIIMGNYLFFHCPICNIIHSLKVANNIKNYNFSRDMSANGIWIWNEDLVRPTLNHCFHVKNSFGPYKECQCHIQHGYINRVGGFSYLLLKSKDLEIQKKKTESLERLVKQSLLANLIRKSVIPNIIPLLSVDKWPIKMK
jgi:hypothetical protein